MQKTKIEWVKNPDGTQGFTSNPIKGYCPVKCRLPDGTIYCYGKACYDRFYWMQEEIGEHGYFAEWEIESIKKRKKPAGIFICSTYEIFHPDTNRQIEDESVSVRDKIFETIEACPQHRFYILTKMPGNIDRPMPDNVYLGCSITGKEDQWGKGFDFFLRAEAKKKFISFEPLLAPIEILGELVCFDWIIVGRLTGYGKKHDPKLEWIKEIIWACDDYAIKVFLKDNLREIWGEPLIQEMPE